MNGRLQKIISTGETGVSRAALDAAIALGLSHGGYCRRYRLAEDGTIPEHYNLTEADSGDYSECVRLNTAEADSIFFLHAGHLGERAALDQGFAIALHKPNLMVNLKDPPRNRDILDFLESNGTATVYISGPRESVDPGIGKSSLHYLLRVLNAIMNGQV